VGGANSTHGRDEKHIQDFDQKTERNRPIRRPRYRQKGNSRMDVREVG